MSSVVFNSLFEAGQRSSLAAKYTGNVYAVNTLPSLLDLAKARSLAPVTVQLGSRVYYLDVRTLEEINRVALAYKTQLDDPAYALASNNLPNDQANLLLAKDESGNYLKEDGNFVHKPGWCLSFASLVQQEATATVASKVRRAYLAVLANNPFLKEGINFLPQRWDMLHFHMVVAREVTASIPTEHQKHTAISLFIQSLQPRYLFIKQPDILLAGLTVAKDGTLILKAFPLNDAILALRERMEKSASLIDEVFDDNNKTPGGQRKPHPARIYHISLGRVTEQLTPEQFKQFVDYVRTYYGHTIFGVYTAKGTVLSDTTSYFQHPLIYELK